MARRPWVLICFYFSGAAALLSRCAWEKALSRYGTGAARWEIADSPVAANAPGYLGVAAPSACRAVALVLLARPPVVFVVVFPFSAVLSCGSAVVMLDK